MPRKPFSGKQKKAQLQERRAKKRGDAANNAHSDDSDSDSQMEGNHEITARRGDAGAASPKGSNGRGGLPTGDQSSANNLASSHYGGGSERGNNPGTRGGGGVGGGPGAPGVVANATLSQDKRGVRSVFRKEERVELEKRRARCYRPLRNRHFEPGIPFNEWFLDPMNADGPEEDSEGDDGSSSPSDTDEPTTATAAPAGVVGSGEHHDGGGPPGSRSESNAPESQHSENPAARGTRGARSRGQPTITGAPSKPIKKGPSEPPAAVVVPLSIELPSRPHLRGDETREEAIAAETAAFEHWYVWIDEHYSGPRRGVPTPKVAVNLFERNVDVWRQLWRTVEHSDVTIIVADARYPIFHLPAAVFDFVIRRCGKRAVVVLNKIDLISREELDRWKAFLKAYLEGFGEVPILEFSCAPEDKTVTSEGQDTNRRRKTKGRGRREYDFTQESKDQPTTSTDHTDGRKAGEESGEDSSDDDRAPPMMTTAKGGGTRKGGGNHAGGPNFKGMEKLAQEDRKEREVEDNRRKARSAVAKYVADIYDTCRRLAAKTEGGTTAVNIGLIGHPNVGKSSLLNCLRGLKVVSVSATAGHTKHMQTIPVPEENANLLDCPGLCFPVVGVPRPLQAVMGTHQIAQTRDPQSGVAYLAHRLPIETIYGLRNPDNDRSGYAWTPYDLCEAFSLKKGYHVKRGKGGVADIHRGAIALLTEAYEGRLVLYFRAPPEYLWASNPNEATRTTFLRAPDYLVSSS